MRGILVPSHDCVRSSDGVCPFAKDGRDAIVSVDHAASALTVRVCPFHRGVSSSLLPLGQFWDKATLTSHIQFIFHGKDALQVCSLMMWIMDIEIVKEDGASVLLR